MFLLLFCIFNITASEISVFSQKDFLKSILPYNQELAQFCVVGNTEREGALYGLLFLQYRNEKKQLNFSTDIFNMIIDDYFPLYPTLCKRAEAGDSISYFDFIKITSCETIELKDILINKENKQFNVFFPSGKDSFSKFCLLDLEKKVLMKKNLISGKEINYYLPSSCLDAKQYICRIGFSQDLMSLFLIMNVSIEIAYTRKYHEKKLFLPLMLLYKKNSEILSQNKDF